MRLLRKDIVSDNFENLTPHDKIFKDEIIEQYSLPGNSRLYIHPIEGLLHGIYRLRKGRNYGLFYINGGYLMRSYQYPILENPKFYHKMVNYENLHMCGGWTWITNISSNQNILNRVLTGVKPAGEIYCKLEEFPGDIESIRKDFDVEFTEPYFITIAPRKTFGEMFDLDALYDDYLSYAKILRYSPFYDIRKYRDIKLCDVMKSIDRFEELPIQICGLLLGFAVETTVSCIIQ